MEQGSEKGMDQMDQVLVNAHSATRCCGPNHGPGRKSRLKETSRTLQAGDHDGGQHVTFATAT